MATTDFVVKNGLVVNQDALVSGTTNSTNTTTGALVVSGGAGIAGNMNIGGAVTLGSDLTLAGDLAVNGGDITSTSATFNLLNQSTTVNAFNAATAATIGATTGTLTLRNATVVGSNVTQNLYNTVATTMNFAGAAGTLTIGATTGTATIRNATTTLTGNANVNGGTLATNQTTFNLVNTTASTVNFAGAATTLTIGAATGTTNIRNDLDVDGDVNIDGGDLTVSTSTFNLVDTTATTVNFARASTSLILGATTGTTNIRNNLDVDGTLNVDGNSITTTSTTSNVLNTIATTVNAFGAASALNMGATTGTLTLRNPTVVGTQSIQALYNTVATTMNFAGAATTISIGASTGTTTINNSLTVGGSATLNGSNAAISLQPTGTGTVTINPATAGSINNMSIGASTRGSGAFTTLTANNAVTFTQNTASTSTTTGTLVVTGGVGISGAIFAGGGITSTNGTISTGNTAATLLGGNTTTAITFAGSQTTGALTIGGTAQTGTITFDQSASAHTLNIATGSNASGVTKTINLGTGGQADSTTNITLGSAAGGGIITLNNPTLSGGPNGFIRRFDSGYSTTTTGGVLYEIGRFTFSGNSQNISFVGEVRVSTGSTNGTTRFVLNARSETLPTKNFTFSQEQLNFSTTVGIEVYQDTATGLVVIGWRCPISIQNTGWSLTVQERGNYNFFTQTTTLTVLDTTALTQVTGVVPGYSSDLRLLSGTASTSTTTGTLVVTGGVGVSGAMFVGGAIDAASIQNTPIGSTTRSSGAFTTLTANNAVTFTQGTASTTTGTGTLVVTGGVGVSGNIFSGGVVNGVDINSTSDVRLKENITTLTNSIDIIDKINPVSFTWKKDGKKSYGVIAQEIEEILPDVVNTDGEGMKSVSYQQLIPFLIDVIKQQQQEIDKIKKQLNI